ncbi:AraC family transcriptional regulator [Yinghuangia soli]|uniref:AraC family transcriptional regulator n=1 Tax=Yinghuangia soli TaxID=2908204 RepID=A0AA41PVB9_9ACTN|nr:AraC family transcriptional regulator [Yinghuangia soli]MCF2526510.1 AraC family transcriptional regulator [Yinghuangia soli]
MTTALGRFTVAAARDAGMTADRLGRLPQVSDDVLHDDYSRVQTDAVLALWEQVTLADTGSGVGAFAVARAELGTFGVWDQIFAASPDLMAAFGTAGEYIGAIGDPSTCAFSVVENGALVGVRYRTGPAEQDVVTAVEQFGVGLIATRARAAARRDVRPLRVAFCHPAPERTSPLAELFGTRNLDFGAEANEIVFARADLIGPLPGGTPGLLPILRAHADHTLQTARPVRDWRSAFRTALRAAADDPGVSLAAVAARLATTPRTLQRRLAEHNTTWRTELDEARADRATELIRSTHLPMHTIATRTGYSDPRALRRAVHRWHNTTPAALRGTGQRGASARSESNTVDA